MLQSVFFFLTQLLPFQREVRPKAFQVQRATLLIMLSEIDEYISGSKLEARIRVWILRDKLEVWAKETGRKLKDRRRCYAWCVSDTS